MGKNSKEHRKRVAKRNQRIKQTQTSFKNKFQEELLKQIELEKQRIAENGGTPPTVVNPELEEGDMS
jgi:hypothetical protein